ncbi:hypothetical protein QBC38DRAFT_480041 [Podospora fimiseda]|uniref:Uncharacterized protein n=1 Tax=Podospora fimiseda TaxID=252190 RepID=A0AAN7GTK2_9PEZI|nr:hypothetical protein QBC38DRAFT_480041 [Podospora fimiseda]
MSAWSASAVFFQADKEVILLTHASRTAAIIKPPTFDNLRVTVRNLFNLNVPLEEILLEVNTRMPTTGNVVKMELHDYFYSAFVSNGAHIRCSVDTDIPYFFRPNAHPLSQNSQTVWDCGERGGSCYSCHAAIALGYRSASHRRKTCAAASRAGQDSVNITGSSFTWPLMPSTMQYDLASALAGAAAGTTTHLNSMRPYTTVPAATTTTTAIHHNLMRQSVAPLAPKATVSNSTVVPLMEETLSEGSEEEFVKVEEDSTESKMNIVVDVDMKESVDN